MVDPEVLESVSGIDPEELQEWYESLEDVLHRYGPDKLRELLTHLQERAYQRGVKLPFTANTPYINTIHHSEQQRFPGDLALERRIKSIVRWNAMAMVNKANKRFEGIGGHISTFASSATLYEVGQNHFFHGRSDKHTGDMVYFRDAMGFGDVKFLAMIGAFLGWQGVLFTIFLSSVAGVLVALPLRIFGRTDWSSKIPFGPYLALGAVVWLGWGTELVTWYLGLMRPGP